MKNAGRSQTEPTTRINRLLDALRIQAERLDDLALKAADRDDNPPSRAERGERRPTMSRR